MFGWDAHDILLDLYGSLDNSSRRDIEFNGRPALLIENDYDSDELRMVK